VENLVSFHLTLISLSNPENNLLAVYSSILLSLSKLSIWVKILDCFFKVRTVILISFLRYIVIYWESAL